ncbi:MAG: DUF480 domain-containing protein [Pirellulales bacterium]
MDPAESQSPAATEDKPAPRWQPLPALARRVLGVLVEKAKTTPDGYPMTINSMVSGCNQKSNRAPTMNVEPEDLEPALDLLRQLGAVAIIQGGGRVDKYRHYIYEWLGVGKAEAAVMAELLLRGAQTEGELRGRAARMEPIADLTALRPILDSLKLKKLVFGLTPEGRGHVITHALYEPRELDKLRGQYAAGAPPIDAEEAGDDAGRRTVSASSMPPTPVAQPPAPAAKSTSAQPAVPAHDDSGEIRSAVEDLRSLVLQLRSELADLAGEVSSSREEIKRLRDALGG